MKSLIAFSHVLLAECGERCGVSTARDSITLSRRIEHEGISFLTITLPAFAKSLERALANGRVDDNQFPGFARTGGLPRFLGGFLRLVFDLRSASLLDEPSVEAIRCVRQFCMAFAKISLPCSDARTKAAFDKFVECDDDVRGIVVSPHTYGEFRRLTLAVFGDSLDVLESLVMTGDLIPHHGPGSTADRLLGNEKWNQPTWPVSLNHYFPAGEFLFPNLAWWRELQGIDITEPGSAIPVKVIAVPKTLKAPRIIAVEPTSMQYAQQSISSALVTSLEASNSTYNFVGFTDQIPNREMARQGSLTGALATLDLSDASDRVSNQHVLELLRFYPGLSGAVQACRSTTADVLGHGLIPLAKFASMGSALCFPIEAMVFCIVVLLGIQQSKGSRLTEGDLESLRGRVRIYGDDIIVPVEYTSAVIRSLEDFGLKVNHAKSFGSGSFRESCGGDYFNGEWVTPIRVRNLIPESLQHVDRIVSSVSLRNQLFAGGWSTTVEWLDRKISKVLPLYPEVEPTSSALGRHTFGPVSGTKVCPALQRLLVKAFVVDAPLPASPLNEHGALMKFFIERGKNPLPVKSFMRAGRPRIVRIKARWIPVHAWGLGE